MADTLIPVVAGYTASDVTSLRELTSSEKIPVAYIPGAKQTIYIPAAAMYARTTTGAATGSIESSTNKVVSKSLDFDSASTEYAQFTVAMPKSWDESTVTAQFVWSHPSTTTNFGVAWYIQGLALSDSNALDTAFGTAVGTTDTGGTTDAIYMTLESGAVTIGNTAAEGDFVYFQIYRKHDDAGDTMAVDARLHGIRLFITTNAATDA